MRRILYCFLFFMPVVSFAAPSLGPEMPRRHHFFGGIQTYSVFERSLEANYGKIHSLQDFLLISYGITDWLSLDLKGGSGNIRARGGAQGSINYPTFLAGGYGFRLRIFQHRDTRVIVGFQHISVHPYRVSIAGIRNKAVLDDWQFPLLISHRFYHVTPYIGVRWSWMNQIHWVNGSRKLEKSKLAKGVGMLVGLDIPLNKRVWFNIEGQFFDATAVAAGLHFSF